MKTLRQRARRTSTRRYLTGSATTTFCSSKATFKGRLKPISGPAPASPSPAQFASAVRIFRRSLRWPRSGRGLNVGCDHVGDGAEAIEPEIECCIVEGLSVRRRDDRSDMCRRCLFMSGMGPRLLKRILRGVSEQYCFKTASNRACNFDFKKSAPLIRLLRVGLMPRTFSTASVQARPSCTTRGTSA